LIGAIAISQSPLAPIGKVLIHGELWDAISPTEVATGQSVVVRKVAGLQLQVEPASAAVTNPSTAKAW
jgi:membrane-bound serine protease (ClpP class)